MDRNLVNVARAADRVLSLSARRAWIEISAICCLAVVSLVALRKESVDRNKGPCLVCHRVRSRSPQGERG